MRGGGGRGGKGRWGREGEGREGEGEARQGEMAGIGEEGEEVRSYCTCGNEVLLNDSAKYFGRCAQLLGYLVSPSWMWVYKDDMARVSLQQNKADI